MTSHAHKSTSGKQEKMEDQNSDAVGGSHSEDEDKKGSAYPKRLQGKRLRRNGAPLNRTSAAAMSQILAGLAAPTLKQGDSPRIREQSSTGPSNQGELRTRPRGEHRDDLMRVVSARMEQARRMIAAHQTSQGGSSRAREEQAISSSVPVGGHQGRLVPGEALQTTVAEASKDAQLDFMRHVLMMQANSNVSDLDNHLKSYQKWTCIYGELPNELMLGLSRLVDPEDSTDWNKLGRQIAEEDPQARAETMDANVLVDECRNVYHMAVSYRHDFVDRSTRPSDRPRQTFTSERWEILRHICSNQMSIRKKKLVRVWVDQIIAARLAPIGKIEEDEVRAKDSPVDAGGAAWILHGLVPYTLLEVAFVPSKNGLIDDMERMWIVVEQLLATLACGVSTVNIAICNRINATWEETMGVDHDEMIPNIWTSNSTAGLDMALNIKATGMVLSKGYDPLDALTRLGRALLSGCLDNCPCFHPDDYKLLQVYGAQLASMSKTKTTELATYVVGRNAPEVSKRFSYADLQTMIGNLGEISPAGTISGPAAASTCRPAQQLGATGGEWDGVYEWLPTVRGMLYQEGEQASWLRSLARDRLEKETQWILYFFNPNPNDDDDDESCRSDILGVAKLRNPLGGSAAYMALYLAGGKKPLGEDARVVKSQLGWPNLFRHVEFEECFEMAFVFTSTDTRTRPQNVVID